MKGSVQRHFLTGVLVIAALLLTSCPQPGAQPVAQTIAMSTQPAPTQAPALPPTATPAPPTETPLPPTNTAAPTLASATATSALPTETPVPPSPTPAPPTETPVPPTPTPAVPMAIPRQTINLRAGPGTEYPVVGSAKAGQALKISGKNAAGNWWQVCCVAGRQVWLSAGLVTVQGNTTGVALVMNIPTPPPMPTTRPTTPPLAAPSVPAPRDIRAEGGGYIEDRTYWWHWDGLAAVTGVDWYFDFQWYAGKAYEAPGTLVRVLGVNPADTRQEDGYWTAQVPREAGGSEVRGDICNYYLQIRIAARDSAGRFTGWLSPPSEPLQLKAAWWGCR